MLLIQSVPCLCLQTGPRRAPIPGWQGQSEAWAGTRGSACGNLDLLVGQKHPLLQPCCHPHHCTPGSPYSGPSWVPSCRAAVGQVRAHKHTAGSASQKEMSGSVCACAPEEHSLSCLPVRCWNSPALFYPVCFWLICSAWALCLQSDQCESCSLHCSCSDPYGQSNAAGSLNTDGECKTQPLHHCRMRGLTVEMPQQAATNILRGPVLCQAHSRRGLTPAIHRSSQGKAALCWDTAGPCLSVGQEGISQLL